jgi:hypothetical protein
LPSRPPASRSRRHSVIWDEYRPSAIRRRRRHCRRTPLRTRRGGRASPGR